VKFLNQNQDHTKICQLVLLNLVQFIRYEQSGELHGLTRVRGFTQDDAHIFCMQDQVKDEFKKVIDLVLYIFKTLQFREF
jgi:threonyl-tRNA synthetase